MRKFSKFSWENSKKCIILAYSQQNLKNPSSLFRAFGRKIQIVGKFWENFEKILKVFDKNSLEKLNFYLFLEKLLLKIESSEKTSFFYNSFFNFGEGGTFPVFPPAGATGYCINMPKAEQSFLNPGKSIKASELDFREIVLNIQIKLQTIFEISTHCLRHLRCMFMLIFLGDFYGW